MSEPMRVAGADDTGERTLETSPEPCTLVIFGATGDLTKRLLMPTLYNLACDHLVPERFSIIGTSIDEMSTDEFRDRMSQAIQTFSTRKPVDTELWNTVGNRLHYVRTKFDDLASYAGLIQLIQRTDRENQTEGNLIFYLAIPPSLFGEISTNLAKAGFTREDKGWIRIIVEKPFGTDLASAIALNRELLAQWREDQIYRIDHYLGKETVQNILAFRFSNGMFEPLWNHRHVDHIQLTVAESVSVEGRGGYYEKSGAFRDMIQNHMLQMLAYVGMEPPRSFRADDIRDEKARLLNAVKILKPDEVQTNVIRGQYGPGRNPDGSPVGGYREDATVDSHSNTETYAALRLSIDNDRWRGVPIYLRSGKSLWKRGTEIAVAFKNVEGMPPREGPEGALDHNMLLFHIQPDQGIEIRFNAKIPGPGGRLQKVNMRFNYDEAFRASRGTGYEVLLSRCMSGDPTLFSRTDFVETAWRIAQPILDHSRTHPNKDFPNYAAGSWGPASAFELVQRDGRSWLEVINRDVLEKIPLFHDCDAIFLNALVMHLKPSVCQAGDYVIRRGTLGKDMYLVCRGRVDVIDVQGRTLATLSDGDVFGEIALLHAQPRNADVRAVTDCELFILEQKAFQSVLREHPQFADSIRTIAEERYHATADAERFVHTWADP